MRLGTVEEEEDLSGGVANALVSIEEWVVQDQGVQESGSLVDQRRVKVGATERGSWLGEGRLQGAEVVDTGGAAGRLKDRLMKPDDLSDGEVAHQAKRR